MLEAAASTISLARKHGKGGFSELQLRDYPELKDVSNADHELRGSPYPADADVLPALRKSGLPAALLLIQTFEICRPVAKDARLQRAGEEYVKRVNRRETQLKRPVPQLTRLALRAFYQLSLARGRLPERSRSEAVHECFARFALSPRMRAYWSSHPDATKARQVIGKLAPNRWGENPGSSGLNLRALTIFHRRKKTETEKREAMKAARSLFCEYPPTTSRERKFDERITGAPISMRAFYAAHDALLDDVAD